MATISAQTTTPFTIAQGGTLLVARQGSIVVNGAMQNGVNGSSQGNLQIEGTVSAFGMNTHGALFTMGNNQVSVTATGYLSGAATGLTIAGNGSNTVVNGGMIESGGATAINISGGSNVFKFIDSSVIQSASRGLYVSNGNNELENAGFLNGVFFTGGANTVTNEGMIVGKGTAALEFGAGGGFNAENQVTNYGTIRTASAATSAITTGAPKFVMFNSGTVESVQDDAISALTNTGGLQITNTGWIIASKRAIDAGANGTDVIVNNGLIQGGTGAVALNGGNDTFDGTNGTTIGFVDGGAGDDKLIGGVGVDFLVGGADKDTLIGGDGADTLNGGIGDDTYDLGSAPAGDTLVDASGTDTVRSTATRSIQPWSFIEKLILEGNANINGTGNAGGNTIFGNGGNNVLTGQGGGDSILGGGGADWLYGQAGSDNLKGEAGNDRFAYQTINDTLAGMGNSDIIHDLDKNGDDIIDLSAVAGVSSFIGLNGFTAPGQVRVQQMGADVLVQINTVGNSVAEGEILVANTTIGNGATQLNSGDFLL